MCACRFKKSVGDGCLREREGGRFIESSGVATFSRPLHSTPTRIEETRSSPKNVRFVGTLWRIGFYLFFKTILQLYYCYLRNYFANKHQRRFISSARNRIKLWVHARPLFLLRLFNGGNWCSVTTLASTQKPFQFWKACISRIKENESSKATDTTLVQCKTYPGRLIGVRSPKLFISLFGQLRKLCFSLPPSLSLPLLLPWSKGGLRHAHGKCVDWAAGTLSFTVLMLPHSLGYHQFSKRIFSEEMQNRAHWIWSKGTATYVQGREN